MNVLKASRNDRFCHINESPDSGYRSEFQLKILSRQPLRMFLKPLIPHARNRLCRK